MAAFSASAQQNIVIGKGKLEGILYNIKSGATDTIIALHQDSLGQFRFMNAADPVDGLDVVNYRTMLYAVAGLDWDSVLFDHSQYLSRFDYDTADISEQLVGLTALQTLSNKTLLTPTIANLTNMQHSHTSQATGGIITVGTSQVTNLKGFVEAEVIKPMQTLIFADTVQFDVDSSNNAILTLNANVNVLKLTDIQDGETGSLTLIQNDAGGWGINAIQSTDLTIKYVLIDTFDYVSNEVDPIFLIHTTKNIVNGNGYLKNNGTGTWSYGTLATVATTGAYSDLSGRPGLAVVATSGSYNDLLNKPTIPTNTNQLTNGAGFITSETSHADVVVDGDFTSQGLMKRGATSGTYSIITDNSANWNTAFGWGNHASAGYLTSAVDGSISNEGVLGVQNPYAGIAQLTSNTSSASGVSFIAGTNVSLGVTTSTNGGEITISSSVANGDKGDITVSNTGGTWTIDNAAVTGAKLSVAGTPAAGDMITYSSMYGLSYAAPVTGSGSSGRVAYWDGSKSLTGSAAFTFNGTNVTSTGTFTGTNFILSSDKRLKERINKMENLNWVDNIEFKNFEFKGDITDRTRYGVIAQEVQKVNPQLVFTDENGYKSVGYIDLLIAKVARQDEIIEQLLKRIEKLEKDEK